MLLRPVILPALVAAMLIAGPLQAAPLSAAEVLGQFNTVVLGNATSNSHTDGRTYIGGSLNGGAYAQHAGATPASNYAGLTVRGAASNVHVNGLGAVIGGSLANSTVNTGGAVVKGAAANTNFNGAAYVEGAAAGGNFNGGKLSAPSALMATNLAAAGSTDFLSVLDGLSDQLKALGSTGSTVSMSGNKATFNAVANAAGMAVFDLTAFDTELFGKGEFAFNLNGASTVILNTDIKNVNISANFLGGSAQALGKQLLWNFYDATNITINNQWGGSLLATGALLTNKQNIEGGVFVNELHQRGEIHLQAFNGKLPAEVPEPGMLVILATGLCLIAVTSRRRRTPGRAPG